MPQSHRKRKLQVLDAGFDTAVESYIDVVLHTTTEHTSQVEQIKQNILSGFRALRSSYSSGYKILKNQTGLSLALKPLVDPKAVMQQVAKGESLFELLGLSYDDLEHLYNAACRIAEEKRSAEAKDAFVFLTAIGASFGECWIGLGITSAQCGEYEEAVSACQIAVTLMPEKADSYLAFAFVFIEMQDFEAAQNIVSQGLQHAKKHAKEPWAQELSSLLVEAKRQITDQFQKSQYDCIGS